jgi:hypothetical protein
LKEKQKEKLILIKLKETTTGFGINRACLIQV